MTSPHYGQVGTPAEKHANGCSVQGARAVEASQFFAQELKFIFLFCFVCFCFRSKCRKKREKKLKQLIVEALYLDL